MLRLSGGFTLVELLVALLILSLLLVAAPIAFDHALPGLQMDSDAREMARTLREARARAISDGRESTVTIDVTQRYFQLDEDEQYERSLQLEPRGEDELPAACVAAAAEEAARRDSARMAGMRRLEEAADQLAASCRKHAIARREREASAAGLEV